MLSELHSPPLVAERLSTQDIRAAFVLVRDAIPGISLAGWLRHARRVTSPGGPLGQGVLVARDPGRGQLRGAVCFRRNRDVGCGFMLVAEHFVATDLMNPESTLAALVLGLEEVAITLKCQCINAQVNAHTRWLAEYLRACGLSVEGIVLGWRPGERFLAN